MLLKNLSLVNFKNYNEVSLSLHSKLNCFVGNNGCGKTNLLDAIYYLCMCKSYFNSSDVYNFRYDTDFLVLQGNFISNETESEIYCGIKQGKKKQFRKNKKEYQRLSDHIGNYPVVMVSPADSSLILDGGEERRKYMNGVISQYNREYLESTIQYSKVLAQRNRLLKDHFNQQLNSELLDVYTQQLIPLGERIYAERKLFVDKLEPVFQKYYKIISQENEAVELKYTSNLSGENYSEQMIQHLEKDKIVQHTTVGPHKDDLELNMKNIPMKKVASQGQQKTFLVALKLAQFEFLSNLKKVQPILLLDDIFDKFDEDRVKQILHLVTSDEFGQIFITHHNQNRMQEILSAYKEKYTLFKVFNNEIELLS